MKSSSATSAKATGAPRRAGRSSLSANTRTSAEGFTLAGPSDPPDPRTHAYRKDLADIALAGRVISSHYAQPALRALARGATLRRAPHAGAEAIEEVQPGEPFEMLEDSLGWAWGYAGTKRLVGYVESEALAER